MKLSDVLAAAIADYNELVGRGEDPRFPGPARDARVRLHRLAEAEGLTAAPSPASPVQIIYPGDGGTAGEFGRFAYGHRLVAQALARVMLYDPAEPPSRDVPLWCLRAATEGELATATAAVVGAVA